MGITVDPTFVPPPPLETVTSPDGLLSAKIDPGHGSVLLWVNYSTQPTPLPQRVRFYRGDGTLVRSGDPAWAPGGIAVAYDHEAPIGRPATYYAVPVYRDDSVGVQTAGVTVVVPWVADPSQVWVKSPGNPAVSALLDAATFEEDGRAFRPSFNAIQGSRLGVATWDVAQGLAGTLTVKTDDFAQYEAMLRLFDGGPLLIQANPECSGIPDFYALPDGNLASLRRVPTGYGYGKRDWPIHLTECIRPATLDAPLRVPGNSYAETDPDFPTYQAAMDTGATYADEMGIEL